MKPLKPFYVISLASLLWVGCAQADNNSLTNALAIIDAQGITVEESYEDDMADHHVEAPPSSKQKQEEPAPQVSISKPASPPKSNTQAYNPSMTTEQYLALLRRNDAASNKPLPPSHIPIAKVNVMDFLKELKGRPRLNSGNNNAPHAVTPHAKGG